MAAFSFCHPSAVAVASGAHLAGHRQELARPLRLLPIQRRSQAALHTLGRQLHRAQVALRAFDTQLRLAQLRVDTLAAA